MRLPAIQAALREASIDGWLFYDHHHRDPLAYSILGLDPEMHVSRRWFYLIPAQGEPSKLLHSIESTRLDTLPGATTLYSSWQQLESALDSMLAPYCRVAMQYSPSSGILYVSMVDAGTIELIRSLGKEVVSSAGLVARFQAVLTQAQIDSHYAAQQRLDRILAAAWPHIGHLARASSTDEFATAQWLSEAMRREGLTWEHGPNVSSGPNSANPHYEPTSASSRRIGPGDFVLIDIWAKLTTPDAIYYDITWTGVVARPPTAHEQAIFTTVTAARDAVIAAVQSAYAAGEPIAGFQADDVARGVIRDAGYADYFTHRTGHNIGREIHGAGAHLDNLETHDTRLLLPNTCFSVEPGIYLPGTGAGGDAFGIRSEVNMITMPTEARVTGAIQTSLVSI